MGRLAIAALVAVAVAGCKPRRVTVRDAGARDAGRVDDETPDDDDDGTTCAEGLRRCDGRCIDEYDTEEHCGACGAACEEGKSCIWDGFAEDYTCGCSGGVTCPGDDGLCETSLSEDDNCGQCGVTCAEGRSCTSERPDDVPSGTHCECATGLDCPRLGEICLGGICNLVEAEVDDAGASTLWELVSFGEKEIVYRWYVCAGALDDVDARVVCRGAAAPVIATAEHTFSSSHNALVAVHCDGSEQRLAECDADVRLGACDGGLVATVSCPIVDGGAPDDTGDASDGGIGDGGIEDNDAGDGDVEAGVVDGGPA